MCVCAFPPSSSFFTTYLNDSARTRERTHSRIDARAHHALFVTGTRDLLLLLNSCTKASLPRVASLFLGTMAEQQPQEQQQQQQQQVSPPPHSTEVCAEFVCGQTATFGDSSSEESFSDSVSRVALLSFPQPPRPIFAAFQALIRENVKSCDAKEMVVASFFSIAFEFV